MSVRIVHRPARSTRHLGVQQPKVIEAPPTLGQVGGGGGTMQMLLPMIGILGSVAMMAVMRSGPIMVVGAAMLVATMAGASAAMS